MLIYCTFKLQVCVKVDVKVGSQFVRNCRNFASEMVVVCGRSLRKKFSISSK